MPKELEVRYKEEVGKEYLEIIPSSIMMPQGVSQIYLLESTWIFYQAIYRKWLIPSASRIAVCVE